MAEEDDVIIKHIEIILILQNLKYLQNLNYYPLIQIVIVYIMQYPIC